MTTLYIIAAVAVVAIIVIVLFNQLIAKRQMVNNGWADIDVQLKRRADLIPQLVTTVQAYATHERNLFEEVAARRNAALAAGDNAAARGAAESELSKPVGRLIALGEAYPELKANQNFLDLQNELSDTENKIEMARRFYNGAVRELNTVVESFPSNIVAGLFGIAKRAFFEITATGDRDAPTLGLNSQ
ncbi:MAG: LemA family protein [Hyphomonadaceae bacterium]